MASASIRKTSVAPHSTSESVTPRRDSGLPAFLVAVVALSLLSQPLLVQSVGTAAPAMAPGAGLPATGLLSWAIDLGLHSWNLPFQVWPFVAVAANALFLSLLWRDLAGVFGRGWASGLTLLAGCNPLFLLPIAAGGSQAVGLLAFYGLCRTLRRLQTPVEAFTYLRIAGWLCILLCLDLQTLALSTMVAPWLLLVMPTQMLRKAPGSFYGVLPAVRVSGRHVGLRQSDRIQRTMADAVQHRAGCASTAVALGGACRRLVACRALGRGGGGVLPDPGVAGTQP